MQIAASRPQGRPLTNAAEATHTHSLSLYRNRDIHIHIYTNKKSRAMGSVFGSTAKSKEEIEMALSKAKDIVSSTSVVVFSKTYCGYCTKVKKLLSQLGASYKVMELDEESDGSEMQSALAEWTGQRTVPNVFIGGKHIGGCDMVLQKHQGGELVSLLTESGAISK